jgi:hypothetical protein
MYFVASLSTVIGYYFLIAFINSSTPKCVPAGTKNSRLEDFLLSKQISQKHPHHDEPFSRLAAWF